MLENQIDTFRSICSNEDLQQYTGDAFWDLIQAVIFSDPLSGITTVKNIKDLIFHLPTVLFWDKMRRYLMGTFYCFQDQVKMAEKFNNDNSKYNNFVKKQIHLINAIDDDQKIDYFAALTRCFLLTNLEQNLFFKLSKFIVNCTPEELHFLSNIPFNYQSENTVFVSTLYQYGLFVQKATQNNVTYILSDFGKALKQNSLNFDCGLNGSLRITSYNEITQLNIAEPTTADDIERIFNESNIVIDAGTAEI